MSTKQAVIFAFMIIFLAVMLVTLGMWFHYSLELSIKEKHLEALESRKRELKTRRERLDKVLTNVEDPDKALTDRVKKQREMADAKYVEVHTDPTMPLKRLYEEKQKEIDAEWKKVGTEWKAVYEDWTKRNGKIGVAVKSLVKDRDNYAKQIAQESSLLATELKNEDALRKTVTTEREGWEKELAATRFKGEELDDKINKVTRDLERASAFEADGKVTFADPEMNSVTVDVGYRHGARKGMKFKVFSGRHNVPVLKGAILLTEVGVASSKAVMLPSLGQPLADPNTGWEAPDPKMRYSIYSASGADGTDPQALEKKKTKRDLVDDIRQQRHRLRGGDDEETEKIVGQSSPPLILGKAFEPITEGDWISNTEFVRILTDKAFNEQTTKELLGLKDVNLGALTFYFADTVRPFRQEFLKRLCERNGCRASASMSPDVDYVVTTHTAASIDLLERKLAPYADKAEVSPDVANHRSVLKALKEGRKYGMRTITEDRLEAFFTLRQRKSELAKGKVIQAGQSTFYVVGETMLRSVEETGLHIKEMGGVLARKLDSNVDYVVVGAGLTNAKMDRKTGRIYYAGEEAPTSAKPFYEAVREMGLKILREEELGRFFGRE